MSYRIIYDRDDERACLIDDATDCAFGPVFKDVWDMPGHPLVRASERLKKFCDWLCVDPRKFTDLELEAKYAEFISIENPKMYES